MVSEGFGRSWSAAREPSIDAVCDSVWNIFGGVARNLGALGFKLKDTVVGLVYGVRPWGESEKVDERLAFGVIRPLGFTPEPNVVGRVVRAP